MSDDNNKSDCWIALCDIEAGAERLNLGRSIALRSMPGRPHTICRDQKRQLVPDASGRWDALVHVHEGPCSCQLKKTSDCIKCIKMEHIQPRNGGESFKGGDVVHMRPDVPELYSLIYAENGVSSLMTAEGMTLRFDSDYPFVVCKNQFEGENRKVRCHFMLTMEGSSGHKTDCSCGHCSFAHAVEPYPSAGLDGGCNCMKAVVEEDTCCIM